MEDHGPSGILKYIWSTDHKMIAKQYLFTGMFMAVNGAFMAYVFRIQLAFPGTSVPGFGRVSPGEYNALVTNHGSIMIFWVAMPVLIAAFGNFLIPLMIGADDMIFPRINRLSFQVFFLSVVVLLTSLFVEGGGFGGGWTAYPPLSRVPRWRDAAEAQRAIRGEPARGRLRDVDAAGRAHVVRIFSWSLMVGVVGGSLGVFGAAQGMWGAGTILVMAVIGWAVSLFFPLILSSLSGRAAETLYAPSGRGTPKQREDSLAESLAARGMYDEGVASFEEAIAEDPSDPTPYLKIARIYRDRLGRLDEAARWFKRALDESSLSAGTATLTPRELVEL